MNEESVRRHFGAAAATYEQHANIQRMVARDLLEFCPERARNILELGCGTGMFTRMLAARYTVAAIAAVDNSEEMLRIARLAAEDARITFVLADARAEGNRQFDLVASNAALQWIPDLGTVLDRLRQQLTGGGTVAFSYFGPGTYRELRSALSSTLGFAVALPSDDFLSSKELATMVGAQFAHCRFENRVYTEEFPSLRALLANIRATGTRGAGMRPQIAWTRGLIRDVEERYRSEFQDIRVTYEITFCMASR